MTGGTARRQALLWRTRAILILFTVGLVAAGLTAFPLRWELGVLAHLVGVSPDVPPDDYAGLQNWIATVRQALYETYGRYPFIAYGTDWLAFAHIVIGIAFIGAVRDPVRNLWVITWGMIACVLVVPLALVCGTLRGIPFYWQLIDCSFGVFGIIPLWLARRWTAELTNSDLFG
jgi:succinate-acetate transporter protein